MKIYYNPKLKNLARYLRTHSTKAEIKLWNELRARKMLGYQFMRQKPIYNYIVDFYCSRLKLVIELDGDSHDGRERHDRDKDSNLTKMGIYVLRFTNDEVYGNMEGVLQAIEQWIGQNTK
ncbi:MAG TPA: endonuclease domain-containing protein [Balneolales bacterium]|jgi:very-short-patch-repair endonuclease|nr:endonuclease domain-containing protein [Balneolales bacterium]